jgi:hypothetical protein
LPCCGLALNDAFVRLPVVQFVSNHPDIPLVCPKATNRCINQILSPHGEDDLEDIESVPASKGEENSPYESDASCAASEVLREDEADGCSAPSSKGYRVLLENAADYCFDLNGISISVSSETTNVATPESIGYMDGNTFDDSESCSVHFIGALVDQDFAHAQTKRSVSKTFESESDDGSKKRARQTSMREHLPFVGSLVSLFGIGALQKKRDDTPDLLTSDEEDWDRQLGEELGGSYETDEDRIETPVPLLTPPGSPLTVEWEGSRATMCEWPSNLVVDSALQAIIELRPMSPGSLETLERDEQDRIEAMSGWHLPGEASLTPLLRSIRVID